ncbi:hypothetical protein HSBAA_60210 [Vreelandella sulfidaeris]|uniref:Uncharacterized protein n=1 Tax=Vreelandella sulfidaeris TaxID=115553 RepID=A0A455UF46_9GAMM|nr:hypothetical protein HSBAA_60210 [Halomonas sulfidaeris]
MGLVDIGIPPTATLGNFEPRMQILDLPFLIADYDTMVETLDGEVGREILDTLNGHNMVGVNFWGAGFRHITNNDRPIENPEDMDSIRMRTMQAPIIISTYENLGLTPPPWLSPRFTTACSRVWCRGRKTHWPTSTPCVSMRCKIISR